jgi:hypothetical protein
MPILFYVAMWGAMFGMFSPNAHPARDESSARDKLS